MNEIIFNVLYNLSILIFVIDLSMLGILLMLKLVARIIRRYS